MAPRMAWSWPMVCLVTITRPTSQQMASTMMMFGDGKVDEYDAAEAGALPQKGTESGGMQVTFQVSTSVVVL